VERNLSKKKGSFLLKKVKGKGKKGLSLTASEEERDLGERKEATNFHRRRKERGSLCR